MASSMATAVLSVSIASTMSTSLPAISTGIVALYLATSTFLVTDNYLTSTPYDLFASSS